MRPFIDAINAGAPAVMVGHAQYPALGDPSLPASLSPVIYQTLRAIPFRGVTITDSLGAGAVNLRFDFPVAAVKALAAGVDGLLTTDGNQAPADARRDRCRGANASAFRGPARRRGGPRHGARRGRSVSR